MADTATQLDDLATRAAEPAAVTADGQSSTDRTIPEQIQAIQFQAAAAAAKKRRRGLRLSKIINPGPLSDGGANIGPGAPFGGGYW